jgi:hypothetical protein
MRDPASHAANATKVACYDAGHIHKVDRYAFAVVNEFRGSAENVVQARDIHGGVHVHQRPAAIPPRQLPAVVPGFTGRQTELAALDTFLDQDAASVVVTGTAGVGKTAMVVQWAHHARARFPDGQLYVDLRGYAQDSPMAPEHALEGFLHALGVSAELVPARLDAQAAHYRSLLAGRRVLVVIDNAASPEQVRPLLPGSSGCLAVITSRSSLAGLVARDGASRLTLDLLSSTEAVALVRHVAGPARSMPNPPPRRTSFGTAPVFPSRCASRRNASPPRSTRR